MTQLKEYNLYVVELVAAVTTASKAAQLENLYMTRQKSAQMSHKLCQLHRLSV